MRQCDKCDALIFDGRKRPHKCPPRWRCWFADQIEDTVKEVYARDLYEAATQYVRAWDDAENIAGRFQVTGEWVPSYHAERIGAGPLL